VPLEIDERNLKLEEGYEDISKLMESMEVDKPLPAIPVTLEMHKASLVAVIKALSKAANVSVMISPEISGVVTVVVDRKPWDEVFKGVLKTNRLTYSWEGDILRVKNLEDLEEDIKITALKAQHMVQKLMAKRAEPPVTRFITLRYVKATNVAAIINSIVFHKESELETTDKTLDIKGATGTEAGEESVLRRRTEDAITTTERKREDWEPETIPGFVKADVDSNTVVVQAPRPVMKIVYYIIRKMDRPRKQVKIKAYIVETDSNTARDIGVRWGGINQYQHPGSDTKYMFGPGGSGGSVTTYQGQGAGPQSGLYSPYFGPGVSGQGYGASFPLFLEEAATRGSALNFMMGTIGGNILEFQLLSLAQDNKLKILSSPSLTTQDNKEATIKDGVEIPFITGVTDGIAQVSWREASLSLRITPHIINTNNLHMQIQIKKDEIDFEQTQVEGIPIIKKKLAETELVTRDGETIVIGGLTRQRLVNREDGIPYLKDIPVLGWAFKHDLKQDEQAELLIFITPKILDFWNAEEVQKSFEQIDRELKEDGVSMDGAGGDFIQGQ
jgi:type IV pilus assembly protein PilQ